MTIEKRLQLIRRASIIALCGNFLLAAVKLILGYVSGSLAVLGDGIDSATDVGIACITLLVSTVITRPSDKEHPWGHARAETTATLVLSFIILFAGSQLGFSAVKDMISILKLQGATEQNTLSAAYISILATLISIAGKLLLSFSQIYFGKKANSSMVLANAQNMRNDVIISVSILIGLTAAHIFQQPILDPITALLVSVWVIKNAVHLFFDINMELMDGNTNQKLYNEMFTAIKTVQGAQNPHRARIRKIATYWDIDLDIEVDAKMTVHDAHEIAEKVEIAIRNHITDVYDIMVHIEPAGHNGHHPTEQYGLSEVDLSITKEHNHGIY